jgi:uncharacterized protein YndB with AHSA1/START domain
LENQMSYTLNPTLDLILERTLDVPLELVWKAWTDPEHIVKWFCPKPYEVYHCEVDLRPGGIFRTDMRGPDMPESPNSGCILEVIKNQKFVWTSALGPNYRPTPIPENGPDILFTGMILLESLNGNTKYTAIALHPDEETCNKHREMGFHEGWGICIDQLVQEIKLGHIT